MDRYLNQSTNQHFIFQFGENYKLNIKQKCPSVVTERCILSNEQFIAIIARKVVMIFTKSL